MGLTELLGRIRDPIREGDAERVERLGQAFCAAGDPAVADVIAGVDLSRCEAELASMLREARSKLTPRTRALYWEFDPDNGWSSALFACHAYRPEENGDDDWASDNEDGDILVGPPAPELAARFDPRWSGSPGAPANGQLVARTLAALVRAASAVPPLPVPLCAGHHDQALVHRVRGRQGAGLRDAGPMPAPTASRGRGPHEPGSPAPRLHQVTWTDAASSPVAVLEEGEPWLIRGLGLPEPVAGWSGLRLEVQGMHVTDYLANDAGVRLCSPRLRELIDGQAGELDRLQWLPVSVLVADSEDRRYWLLNLWGPDPSVIDPERSLVAGDHLIKPVFLSERVARRAVLGLPGESLRWYVTDPVRRALRAAGITGMAFSAAPTST